MSLSRPWSLLLMVLGVLTMCVSTRAESPTSGADKAKLRVGTFDSRAVAVAYAASEAHKRSLKPLLEEHRKAKAAGDQAKVEQLEAQGKAQQEQLHYQGFGTASVSDILAQIKDQLPAIAKEAGVDLIVSKWDIAYRISTAECIDLTDRLVQPFQPNERTQRIIKELSKHAPISIEELKRHKDAM